MILPPQTMSSFFIYLRLLIFFSAFVLSALNPGLFSDGSAVNTYGDLEEPDQDFSAGYDWLLGGPSSPSESPTTNWNDPPVDPLRLQEVAVQQEQLITNNNVPPQQAAGPIRGNNGIWNFNRSPPTRDSSNSCPAGSQPLGKRQVCSIDSADGTKEPVQNRYNPDLNFLFALPSNPPPDHREPCGLFSGAPRWAICDSANPKGQYPAGITIAKATLCMPLVLPPLPPSVKKIEKRGEKLQQANK